MVLDFFLVDQVDLLVDLAQEGEELNGHSGNFWMLLECIERKLQSALVHDLLAAIVLTEEPLERKLQYLERFLEISKELDEEAEDHEDELRIIAVEATTDSCQNLEECLLRRLRQLLRFKLEQLRENRAVLDEHFVPVGQRLVFATLHSLDACGDEILVVIGEESRRLFRLHAERLAESDQN